MRKFRTILFVRILEHGGEVVYSIICVLTIRVAAFENVLRQEGVKIALHHWCVEHAMCTQLSPQYECHVWRGWPAVMQVDTDSHSSQGAEAFANVSGDFRHLGLLHHLAVSHRRGPGGGFVAA